MTLELWSQLGGQVRPELTALVRLLCSQLHKASRLCVLVVPPAEEQQTGGPGMFGQDDFSHLAPHVDYFSLMTYDYSSVGRPGPNSPLEWAEECVVKLDPDSRYRSKILLGLNMYGYSYTAQVMYVRQ